MKSLFLAALFSSTLLTPVLAQNLEFDSKISAVTVYPQGAQVTRVAPGVIENGEHVIIIDDLPGHVNANSVRVEGSSAGEIEIGSIDVRQHYVSGEDQSSKRVELEKQIENLSDDIKRLSQEIADANARRAMVQGLAGRAIMPRKPDGQASALVISAEELKSLLALSSEQFSQISKFTTQAKITQRELAKDISELNKQISELAPKQELKTIVAIHVTSDSQGPAEFLVRYNVQDAGWAPVYDARLTLGEGKDAAQNAKLKITRRASVRQATSEAWDDIALTLSTARPNANTQVPRLRPYVLREKEVYLSRRDKRKRNKMVMTEMAVEAPLADDSGVLGRAFSPKKVRVAKAQIVKAGFLAEYKISGSLSVGNTGVEKNVVINSDEKPAKLSIQVAPRVDKSAYLVAKFAVEGVSPWLPGTVMLSRNGVFLGKAALPLLKPGLDYSLGFGVDDFIKVEHAQVADKKSESGIISTFNVAERKFVTTVKNLHDFAMPITVRDRVPYGTHEDIVVKATAGSTKPSDKNVDNQRGILSWENIVEPKGEVVIKFGYTVTWPKEMNITPVR